MSLFESNMTALRRHWPDIAERIQVAPLKECVRIFKARDGGVAYGIRKDGQTCPITDPNAPTAGMRAQFTRWSGQLADFTRPVLIVGLYPGNELLYLFDRSEENKTPHCPQPIWVCVDSTVCLYGFLCSWDARRVLESPRVSFFWHEQMPARIKWLREHPEFPHHFTLISGASGNLINGIMPPLAELVEERNQETERLKQENEKYYNALDDRTLAQIIAGADSPNSQISGSRFQPSSRPLSSRRPRLLMPTVAWSTYVQHSARDTCAAFDNMGWESRVLKMEAMLSPYYLVKTIHEFKPDVFLFIDHMRYEAEEFYPRNMMFVSWIQDDMANLQCQRAGEKLAEYAAGGKRDLVVGYVDKLDIKYGYPKERLAPINIPANPRIFHPVELTDEDCRKHGCDLAFMSNVSMPPGQVVEHVILPEVEPLGISRASCMRIHDDLWRLYRAGDTLANRDGFLEWLMQYPEFAAARGVLQSSPPAGHGSQTAADAMSAQDGLFRLFYWRLNDTIHRHVVLEWADELGLDIHLYGHGWETHPRFKKYARGILRHGPELNIAYQAARYCLHLNITSGMHQRIWEILTSGARPLLRAAVASKEDTRAPLMRKLAKRLLAESTPGLAAALDEAVTDDNTDGSTSDWIFNLAFKMARAETAARPENSAYLADKVIKQIETVILNRPEWIIPDWEQVSFTDRASFTAKFRHNSKTAF